MTCEIAVVGVGRWGQHVARNLYELGVLSAYVDSRAIPFLDNLGVSRLSFDELLLHESINAAWVATPSIHHYDQVENLLRHGKAVMVEKPITLSLSDADKLQDIANKTGSALLVDYLLCYHPAVTAMQHTIKNDDIGKVRSIQIRRRNSIAMRDYETVWWDLGIHDLAWLYELFKQPFNNISGMQCSTYRKDFVDQAIVLTNIGDINVVHDVCWSSPTKEAAIAVYTDKGLIHFDDLASTDKLLWYDRCEKSGLLSETARKIPMMKLEPLKSSCMHFVDVVNGVDAAKTTHQNYRPVMEALEGFSREMKSQPQTSE